MLLSLITALSLLPPSATPRLDRLVALARLDAAVHYFNPRVVTGASSWDSLFAANAIRIADAPSAAEYRRRVTSLMRDLHDDAPVTTFPQRALRYNGFPSPSFQGSGGYGIVWRSAGSGEVYRVDMGENVSVDVRISEPVRVDVGPRLGAPSPDTTAAVPTPQPPVTVEWRAPYPSAGYRVLAAARLWSTIRLFYPYKSLIGENWDDQFRAALPAVEKARDAAEYGKAIAAFAAHIHDTHVSVTSAALREFIGAVPIGASARLIENQLVITSIADSSAERAGLRVGDVVVSVDGETVGARMARLTPFFAASTPAALRYRLESVVLYGPTATPAQLVVRGAGADNRTLSVPRSPSFMAALRYDRRGSIIRVLPGNVGYIDFDRLPPSMVDSAFRILAGTKAIVLDDRGYPQGTAWAIASRLNIHPGPVVGAKFRRLIVSSPDTTRTTVFEFDQPIPRATAAKYAGKTVLLVDERTISQAEHSGLFFEAANGTEFIGSPTMGANGDVTNVSLPGGISITFTGHDVRHADGRQLQRVGLVPDVPVTPTIGGIRAGRDEVLEAAVKYVGGTGVIPPDTITAVNAAVIALAGEPMATAWGAGGTRGAFRIGVDRAVQHGGMASGHITARSSEASGFGALSQVVRADSYRGKRVRFSAFVRTRDARGTGAGLWMRVDGEGGILAFDNMQHRAIIGTADWTRVAVVLDVPQDAEGIAFGFLLMASGEAWIDDATFEVVGSDVAGTNTMAPSADPTHLAQQRAMYAGAPLWPSNLDFERVP
jgi:C-terminal processing protease CtpA/Prc